MDTDVMHELWQTQQQLQSVHEALAAIDDELWRLFEARKALVVQSRDLSKSASVYAALVNHLSVRA